MKNRGLKTILGLLAVVLSASCVGNHLIADDFQESMQALQWRNIGPFNGGRGTSVVGHPTNPHVFYFGHSSGGLWKTEDAGAYCSSMSAINYNSFPRVAEVLIKEDGVLKLIRKRQTMDQMIQNEIYI